MAIRTIAAGEDFQTIINSADAGDYIQFQPGTHEAALDTNDAMIYLDKSLNIELMAGAILRLADNSTSLAPIEKITNQFAEGNFTVSGSYTGSDTVQFWIKVDGTGTPNTFKWSKQVGTAGSEPAVYSNTGVAMTGSAQLLSDGISITWASTTGNASGSGAIVVVPSTYYGIRVGTGFQSSYIEDVKIFGFGRIDMNQTNNKNHEVYCKNLPSAILFHGRVRRMGVYGIQIRDIHRPVMAYGDHDGTYNAGGSTTGGTSYDAEMIDVIGCDIQMTDTSRYGILMGHPEHRGLISLVRIERNLVDVDGTAIEPNFNLYKYKVSHNWVRRRDSSVNAPIYAWRKSNDGLINSNVQFISTKSSVVTQGAPSGWDIPVNVNAIDNYTI